jgi:hypothetical protein
VDITPKPNVAKRLGGGKGSGFSAAHVDAQTQPKAADPVVDTETPRQRGDRLLPSCETAVDVADMQASIAAELSKADCPDWFAACDARKVALATQQAA